MRSDERRHARTRTQAHAHTLTSHRLSRALVGIREEGSCGVPAPFVRLQVSVSRRFLYELVCVRIQNFQLHDSLSNTILSRAVASHLHSNGKYARQPTCNRHIYALYKGFHPLIVAFTQLRERVGVSMNSCRNFKIFAEFLDVGRWGVTTRVFSRMSLQLEF